MDEDVVLSVIHEALKHIQPSLHSIKKTLVFLNTFKCSHIHPQYTNK